MVEAIDARSNDSNPPSESDSLTRGYINITRAPTTLSADFTLDSDWEIVGHDVYTVLPDQKPKAANTTLKGIITELANGMHPKDVIRKHKVSALDLVRGVDEFARVEESSVEDLFLTAFDATKACEMREQRQSLRDVIA